MPARTALREQVYEQIKQDIITCKLAPGEPLSESQFLGRFQVSKTPIREALTSLVQDGLVEYSANRGFRVTPVSVADIQEIFDARIFLETELFRLAVKKMSDAEISRLEEQSSSVLNDQSPDYAERFLESNMRFHLNLASGARNSRLVWFYEILMNEAQRLFYMDISLHSQELPWAHGHEEILGALRRRDEQAGIAAIRRTLDAARRRVLGA